MDCSSEEEVSCDRSDKRVRSPFNSLSSDPKPGSVEEEGVLDERRLLRKPGISAWCASSTLANAERDVRGSSAVWSSGRAALSAGGDASSTSGVLGRADIVPTVSAVFPIVTRFSTADRVLGREKTHPCLSCFTKL